MNTEADQSFHEINALTESCNAELEKLLAPCERLVDLPKSRGIYSTNRSTGDARESLTSIVRGRQQLSTPSISPEVMETVIEFLRSQSGGVAVKILSNQKLTDQVIRIIYHSLPISIRLAVNEHDFIMHIQKNATAVADALAVRHANEKSHHPSADLQESKISFYVRRGGKKARGPISIQQIRKYISEGRLLGSDLFSTTPSGPWKKVSLLSRVEPTDSVILDRLPEGASLLENVLKLTAGPVA